MVALNYKLGDGDSSLSKVLIRLNSLYLTGRELKIEN